VVLERLLFPCSSLALILVLVYDIWTVDGAVRYFLMALHLSLLKFAAKLG
jgi:hypothetical protein